MDEHQLLLTTIGDLELARRKILLEVRRLEARNAALEAELAELRAEGNPPREG